MAFQLELWDLQEKALLKQTREAAEKLERDVEEYRSHCRKAASLRRSLVEFSSIANEKIIEILKSEGIQVEILTKPSKDHWGNHNTSDIMVLSWGTRPEDAPVPPVPTPSSTAPVPTPSSTAPIPTPSPTEDDHFEIIQSQKDDH